MAASRDFGEMSSGAARIGRHGFSVKISFDSPGDAESLGCISNCRDELLQLVELPECSTVVFDMTGINTPPGGLLGLLASARDRGCEVEVLNPSPEVQEVLRMTKLDRRLLIRGRML